MRLAEGVIPNLIIPSYSFLFIFLLLVTPTANRNTYSVAKIVGHVPRVEALHASTLGWGNATPTELPGARTINYGLTIHNQGVRTNRNGQTIHGPRVRANRNGLTIHGPRVRTIHNGLTIHGPRVRANHYGLTIHGHRVHKQQRLCRSYCCQRRAPLTFPKGLQTRNRHALKRGDARCELPPF